ncbi:hypothetical protein [Pontimicrobium sp. SW4]|uniref:Uncharacterized protein n=1 Tax=Pontimicrobium sp. SW4 TaxID=3153519 RepID=A0AAU7BU17_9FLAO
MKVNSFLLLLAIIGVSCRNNIDLKKDQQKYIQKQSLEGTVWQMDYSMEIKKDTTFHHVPKHWVRIKTFTKNRFTFTGYDFNKNEIAGMGGGTFTLKDSVYVEKIEFHHQSDFNGTEFKGTLYFDSLYLYQFGKVGELTLKERWHRID